MDSSARATCLALLLVLAAQGPDPANGCLKNSKQHDELRRKRQACETTPTTVNGRPSCRGRLIFEDNFDGPNLDARHWTPDYMIAGEPDYEFILYTADAKNLVLRDGLLLLKPTLVSTANNFLTAGILDLRKKGCTSEKEEECYLRASAFHILPPVAAARVRSKDKFSFKYGVVEVRAKLPDGFWLYPELYLEPAERHYGPQQSGRAVLAMARGNARLTTTAGEDVGARRLVAGLQLGDSDTARAYGLRHRDLQLGDAWTADFHVFRFTWTPDRVSLDVDGRRLGEVQAPTLGFQQVMPEASSWTEGERMAPFDREFFVTLGIGAGGLHAFPDNSTSGGRTKPWKNGSPKAKLEFIRDKVSWRDTWAWDDAALQVDYIKVWAL